LIDAAQPDNLRQESDAELVRLLVAGNHDAMTVIFDRYYRMVMSVALRMLHDVAEAEDVVQIVFTCFFQKAHRFDATKGNLGTWLLQYAYGRTLNRKRSLNARHFYNQVPLDEMDPDSRPATCRPAFDLEPGTAARLVEQILPKLNEKQRFVIERVFFEGVKLSEVTLQTGESRGNLVHAYYRGLEKLRGFLRETHPAASHEESLGARRFPWRRKPAKTPESLRGEVQIAKSRIL
jgi:RNA polymerase sigma-70 factor, ECF subfamily